jgi:hypothetical protein
MPSVGPRIARPTRWSSVVAFSAAGRSEVGPMRIAPLQGGSDVSDKRLQFTNSCGLEDVLAAFDDLLLMPDHGAVYVTLAGVVANYATGDAVWPLLVGPQGPGTHRTTFSRRGSTAAMTGCGKSELITSIRP